MMSLMGIFLMFIMFSGKLSSFSEIPDTIPVSISLNKYLYGRIYDITGVLPSVPYGRKNMAVLRSASWLEAEEKRCQYVIQVYNWSKKKQKGVWAYYRIQSSYLLGINEIKDWDNLIRTLKEHRNPYTKRIWKLLNERSRRIIENWRGGDTLSRVSRQTIVDGLNSIIKRRDFYNKEAFKGLKMPLLIEKGLYKIGVRNSDEEIQAFNRLLLESILPITMSPLFWASPQDRYFPLVLERKEPFYIEPYEVKKFIIPEEEKLYLLLFREGSAGQFTLEEMYIFPDRWAKKTPCSIHSFPYGERYKIKKRPWFPVKLCHDGYVFKSGSHMDVVYYFDRRRIEKYLDSKRARPIYLLIIPSPWSREYGGERIEEYIMKHSKVTGKDIKLCRVKINGHYKNVYAIRIDSSVVESIKIRYPVIRCISPLTVSYEIIDTLTDNLDENIDIHNFYIKHGITILVIPERGFKRIIDYICVKWNMFMLRMNYLFWRFRGRKDSVNKAEKISWRFG